MSSNWNAVRGRLSWTAAEPAPGGGFVRFESAIVPDDPAEPPDTAVGLSPLSQPPPTSTMPSATAPSANAPSEVENKARRPAGGRCVMEAVLDRERGRVGARR